MNDKIKKKRIRYLKTLQHLARRFKAKIVFQYSTVDDDYWIGEFLTAEHSIAVSAKTFTEMVRYLHMKVRTEL